MTGWTMIRRLTLAPDEVLRLPYSVYDRDGKLQAAFQIESDALTFIARKVADRRLAS